MKDIKLNTEILIQKHLSELRLESFGYDHELQNLVKEKTCFKSIHHPSCIDLILTNNVMTFQNIATVFTDLSDCHKLALTALKTSITNSKPQNVTYRDYKNFDSARFNDELKHILAKEKIPSISKVFEKMMLKQINGYIRNYLSPYLCVCIKKILFTRLKLEKGFR